MTQFELLFGIKKSGLNKNCVLMPMLTKGILKDFGIEKLTKGKLYSLGNGKNFTLIHTGIGAGFTADAVLYLKNTPCKNIILFGSCGLVIDKKCLSIANMVCPFRCYSNESFSDMLLKNKKRPLIFYPDKGLLESFLKAKHSNIIKQVTCSTIPSLKLEEERLDSFIKQGIDVIDMECSAFFAASKHVRLKAIALFYDSDILKSKPFYKSLAVAEKSTLSYAIKNAVFNLCEFLK